MVSITVAIPPLVAVIGAILWFVSGNPKVQRMGEWMFAIGLLATLLLFGGGTHIR